ncbi:MAG TPA: S-adenosylmethionine:tRNA ribosyltransferase-isomerase, partial [Polyangiaceae bacterium]
MKAASAPRTQPHGERLLVIDPSAGTFADRGILELPRLTRPGDVWVVNDAATLPASLTISPELELRLLAQEDERTFWALAFGSGDVRVPTEQRGPPAPLPVGTTLRFGEELSARVIAVDTQSPRLIALRFEQSDARLWQGLYRAGRPIQYAYLSRPLALWDVQNGYAARPWAFEMPSAGRPLSFELLFGLERAGAEVLRLTHAAGISSTGDSALDRRLPIPERYEIPRASAERVSLARARRSRVVAVGTSVTRALESAELGGHRAGVAELLLGPGYRPRVVSGILSGMHEPNTTHFSLLEAFAPRGLLEASFAHAERAGYLEHEFGDAC